MIRRWTGNSGQTGTGGFKGRSGLICLSKMDSGRLHRLQIISKFSGTAGTNTSEITTFIKCAILHRLYIMKDREPSWRGIHASFQRSSRRKEIKWTQTVWEDRSKHLACQRLSQRIKKMSIHHKIQNLIEQLIKSIYNDWLKSRLKMMWKLV